MGKLNQINALCPDFQSAQGTARFYSNFAVEPGYSGSPILDQRGRIISVTTGTYGTPAGPANGTPKGKPFFGLQPNSLLEFLSRINEKSGGRIDLEL
jgi:S1-C subfamily serine protease